MKRCFPSDTAIKVEFPTSGAFWNDNGLQSAALLGIHSAISYADALRTALGDTDLSAEDHLKAAARLKQVLAERKVEDVSGVQRFSTLVKQKSAIAYGKNRTSENDLKAIVESCRRFSVWINRMGKQLKVEG